MSNTRWGILVVAVAVLGTGCGSAPVIEPPPPPVNITVALDAAANVNPDAEGRASPLVVRVFELTDGSAFAAADFFALWNQEKIVLAATPAKRHEVLLAPGGTAAVALKLDPAVQQVGIAAAFRDIRNSNWRAVVAVSQDPKGPRAFDLSIHADGKNITANIAPAKTAGAGQ